MPDPLPYQSRKPDGTPIADRICPKCQGAMVEGYVLDRAHGAMKQSTWIAGLPETSKFFGLDTSSLKTTGHFQLPVSTYRCQTCGYLESYAIAETG